MSTRQRSQLLPLTITLLSLTLLASAHGGDDHDATGMDMNMSMSSMAHMGTYFSTTIGSSQLWFDSWIPTTSASTAGACIGLALLAIVSRLLSAIRSSCEANWSQSILRQRLQRHIQLVDDSIPSDIDHDLSTSSLPISANEKLLDLASKYASTPAPFIASIDLPRALLFMLQAFVGYLLMLAIMTYSAWFFISIILGFGVGELLFGRWNNRHAGSDIALHY